GASRPARPRRRAGGFPAGFAPPRAGAAPVAIAGRMPAQRRTRATTPRRETPLARARTTPFRTAPGAWGVPRVRATTVAHCDRLASPRCLCSNRKHPYGCASTVAPAQSNSTIREIAMSLERPWLAHYPPGVPSHIDLDEYPSVVSVLETAIENYGDRPPFSNMGKTLSYGDIDLLSAPFAAYLLGERQLKKGDRVAIMMPNCLQYPI